jgi:glycosyltransferase involved in cell wall biosynthesis
VKVLQVITGLTTGGAETQLRLLIHHSRHQSEVACLYNAGAVAEQLRSDGVRVHEIDMSSNRDLTAIRRLAKLMHQGRYDVVHTHLYRACVYGRLAAAIARVPRVIATEHSLQEGLIEGRISNWGIRTLYRLSEAAGDMTIAVSSTVRDHLLAWGVPARRITVIPNGIEFEQFRFSPEARATIRGELRIPAGATVLGAVGRLHPQKNFLELVDACAPLLGEDRRLLVLGDGTERDRLVARAHGLAVSRWVHFAGGREAAPFYSAMDVLISPAAQETFGMAILEGMASGLPVVYRSCPALDQLGTPVEGAFAVGGGIDQLRAGVRHAISRVGVIRQAPPALAVYDMQTVSDAVDAVYEGTEDLVRRPSAIPRPVVDGDRHDGSPSQLELQPGLRPPSETTNLDLNE